MNAAAGALCEAVVRCPRGALSHGQTMRKSWGVTRFRLPARAVVLIPSTLICRPKTGGFNPGRAGDLRRTTSAQRERLPETDEVVATAMIDRLVHHAEILSLKGDSYRLRGKDIVADRPRSARD